MIELIKTDSNGLITFRVSPAPGTEHLYEGLTERDVPPGATHYKNGQFMTKPAQPSIDYVWSDASFAWELNLAAAKINAQSRITAARNASERNGFEAYGKMFDSDSVAIQRISVAVQAAQVVGESFVVDWTCADNSVIPLNYQQVLGLPVFMAQSANNMHIKSRTLKAQIDAATTLEEINAVVW